MSTPEITQNCCTAPYYYIDGEYSLCRNCGNARNTGLTGSTHTLETTHDPTPITREQFWPRHLQINAKPG